MSVNKWPYHAPGLSIQKNIFSAESFVAESVFCRIFFSQKFFILQKLFFSAKTFFCQKMSSTGEILPGSGSKVGTKWCPVDSLWKNHPKMRNLIEYREAVKFWQLLGTRFVCDFRSIFAAFGEISKKIEICFWAGRRCPPALPRASARDRSKSQPCQRRADSSLASRPLASGRWIRIFSRYRENRCPMGSGGAQSLARPSTAVPIPECWISPQNPHFTVVSGRGNPTFSRTQYSRRGKEKRKQKFEIETSWCFTAETWIGFENKICSILLWLPSSHLWRWKFCSLLRSSWGLLVCVSALLCFQRWVGSKSNLWICPNLPCTGGVGACAKGFSCPRFVSQKRF